jgi:hypothetical protein
MSEHKTQYCRGMADLPIEELDEHRAAPFPSSVDKGEVYGEVEPVMIDADIIGWVSPGRLNPVQKRSLRAAADELARSLTKFPPDAQPYYERLLRIARRMLAAE